MDVIYHKAVRQLCCLIILAIIRPVRTEVEHLQLDLRCTYSLYFRLYRLFLILFQSLFLSTITGVI